MERLPLRPGESVREAACWPRCFAARARSRIALLLLLLRCPWRSWQGHDNDRKDNVDRWIVAERNARF